jgi:hypothetical protein
MLFNKRGLNKHWKEFIAGYPLSDIYRLISFWTPVKSPRSIPLRICKKLLGGIFYGGWRGSFSAPPFPLLVPPPCHGQESCYLPYRTRYATCTEPESGLNADGGGGLNIFHFIKRHFLQEYTADCCAHTRRKRRPFTLVWHRWQTAQQRDSRDQKIITGLKR